MQKNGHFYIGEAAKQIGVHKNTLRRWVKEKKLNSVIGRAKRDIRNWLIFSSGDIEKIKSYTKIIVLSEE